MRKIATPTDLETELKVVLRSNRQGATREALETALLGIVDRLKTAGPLGKLYHQAKGLEKQLNDLSLAVFKQSQTKSEDDRGGYQNVIADLTEMDKRLMHAVRTLQIIDQVLPTRDPPDF